MSNQELFESKKQRGRPKGRVRPETTPVRLPDDVLEAVDEWAALQPSKPKRADAVRRLVELGLGKT